MVGSTALAVSGGVGRCPPGAAPRCRRRAPVGRRRSRCRRHPRALRTRDRRRPAGRAVTWRLPEPIDPSAVVLASRAERVPWFCFEQPERERSVVAALGAVVTLEDRGERRFAAIARRWRELAARACVAAVGGPPGSGLVASGGFSFAADGGAARHWSEFSAASLVVPAVSLARWGERVWCTVVVVARPDDLAEELLAGAEDRRLARLVAASLCVLDPLLAGGRTIGGAMAPSTSEAASRAVKLIGAARLEKIVLAREVNRPRPASQEFPAVRVLRGLGRCWCTPSGAEVDVHRHDAKVPCCNRTACASVQWLWPARSATHRPGRRRPPR